jgi:hypothetical protein
MASESKFCERRLLELDRSNVFWRFDASDFRYDYFGDLKDSPKGRLLKIDGEW